MLIVMDIVRGILVFCLGSSAIALAFVTVRAMRFGSNGYEANRRVTFKSMSRNLKGEMNLAADSNYRRLSAGLAVDLKSGKLRSQHRLSTEAIDEVLAR